MAWHVLQVLQCEPVLLTEEGGKHGDGCHTGHVHRHNQQLPRVCEWLASHCVPVCACGAGQWDGRPWQCWRGRENSGKHEQEHQRLGRAVAPYGAGATRRHHSALTGRQHTWTVLECPVRVCARGPCVRACVVARTTWDPLNGGWCQCLCHNQPRTCLGGATQEARPPTAQPWRTYTGTPATCSSLCAQLVWWLGSSPPTSAAVVGWCVCVLGGMQSSAVPRPFTGASLQCSRPARDTPATVR